MSVSSYQDSIKSEATAFDNQILDRIEHGHIPDLRRCGRCEWFYNNVWRDAFFADFLYGEIVRQIKSAVETYLSPSRAPISILEVACGPGHISLELARYGYNVEGLELSPSCIEIASKFASEDPFSKSRGLLKYVKGDFLSYMPEASYDLVLFSCSLHHFRNLDDVLYKVHSLLQPRGLIFVSEPTRKRLSNAEAIIIHLIRALLTLNSHYYYHEIMPQNEDLLYKAIKIIQNEFDYKDEFGANLQSPMDNESTISDMYPALKEHFTQLEFIGDFSFFDRIIGGLRFNTIAEEHSVAQWLVMVDRLLCSEGLLSPEQFHFIGRNKIP